MKKGRKAIAFDLNPLTSFIIEVYATKFETSKFQVAVDDIYNSVLTDITYKNLFSTHCVECGSNDAAYQHFKWEDGEIYEAGIECPKCGLRSLNPGHHKNPVHVPIPFWIPSDKFHESPSFSESFVKSVGSDSFSDLWTNRNLYVLSFIFDKILKVSDKDLRCQLLFGFIQSLHLCSRMCVPRRSAANRAFSTSWGRSAYLCANRQMEMNPLILFKRSCLGKQSVKSALISVKDYLGKIPTVK